MTEPSRAHAPRPAPRSRAILSIALLLALVLASPAPGCSRSGEGAAERLTVYCGRSKVMVQGIFDAFTKETGIAVDVRYGATTALANTILEEGGASPADLFFAQDAGALGALRDAGRLHPLPESAVASVDPRFAAPDRTWVGVSGRARVVAYSTERLKPEELPTTLEGFTDARWKGRIGWPPSNASFQAFVSALRLVRGRDGTLAWLRGIQANAPRAYPKNVPAVQAIANGEIDVAFVNHYYLFTLKREAGARDFPVANYHPPGDLGGMMNVAGVGILDTSSKKPAAERLIAYLLSPEAQAVFARDNFEYPLVAGVPTADGIPPLTSLNLPKVELGSLQDVESTLGLLREAGVLP